MNEYSICYSLDSNYTEQVCASIASVLVNSGRNEHFKFYILDGGLSAHDKSDIQMLQNIKDFDFEYIGMDLKDFSKCPMLKDNGEKHKDYHVTMPTYFRFMLPDVLPELDSVLYLDCDIIVRGSLNRLFKENKPEKAAVMVLDAESEREAERLHIKKYFNAGVMLINLDYWRKNNIQKKLFDYAEKNRSKILWQDQDILNAVLEGVIKEASGIWNYQYFQYEEPDAEKAAESVILHLAGRFKPWLIPFESEIYDEYYEYLRLTPFKNKTAKYRLKASGRRLRNNTGGRVTNIASYALKEDLTSAREALEKNYRLLSARTDDIQAEADKKINDVYDAVSKSYKYMNDKAEAVKNETLLAADEKISKVYEEISKNYKYTDAKAKTAKNEALNITDEKISKVYDEVSKNYKYTDEQDKKVKEDILNQLRNEFYEKTNENYKYTDEQDKKVKADILNQLRNEFYEKTNENYKYTDEQDKKVKEDILNQLRNEFYEKTNEAENKFLKLIEEKEAEKELKFSSEINSVKEENAAVIKSLSFDIHSKALEAGKNTEDLKQRLAKSIEALSSKIDEETHSASEKISQIEGEIKNTGEYTEYLVLASEEKLKNFIENMQNDFKTYKKSAYSKAKETDLKFSEVYSYTNENVSNIYKHINSSLSAVKNNLSADISNIGAQINPLENLIRALKQDTENYAPRAALQTLEADFNGMLEEKDADCKHIMEKLGADFEEKLNNQRIKYEKKLIDAENRINELSNILNELKESPFIRLTEKLRKKP